jgi:hypothetical protein
MTLHLKCHGNAGAIVCPHCGAMYRSLKGYNSHIFQCLPVNPPPLPAAATDTVPIDATDSFPFSPLESLAPAFAVQLSGQHRVSKLAQDAIFANLTQVTRVLHQSLGQSRNEALTQLEEFSTQCERLSTTSFRDSYVSQYFQ